MYKKLHWLCNSPSPYNNFLFAYLAKNLPCEFQVHYLQVDGTEHQSLMKAHNQYKWRIIKNELFDKLLLREAFSKESLFIIGGWQKPIYIGLFLISKGRYVLWTDTPQINRKRNILKEYLRSGFLKFVFLNAKAIMGTGIAALAVLKEMSAPADRLINFPYWVDIPDINPTIMADKTHKFSILSVGRLIQSKAFHHIIDLAEKLRNCGYTNFIIKLVGDGPEYQNLEKMIIKLNMESYISLIGWLEYEDVLKEIKTCDLFIHPAAFEPYGVVVLEAMAHGKAVITSDRTMAGVDRIVTGINGYLYKFGDVEELAKNVMHLIDGKEDRDRIGKNAYKTALKWHIDKALRIVNRLLET